MNAKIVSAIFILALNIVGLNAQTIKFSYDENGNRISRGIEINSLKSGDIRFPVLDPTDIPIEIQKKNNTEGELTTFVYPNPNKGLIKIDIPNIPVDSKTETILYDLSGAELVISRNFESHFEIDISHLADGIYILRIKVNESLFNWKVVKSQY